MKPVALLFVLILSFVFAFAKSDTSYLYFNKDWKNCGKDTAFYYAKVFKNGNFWDRKDFWVKENILQMEGSFLRKDCKTRHGMFKWYSNQGVLETTKLFEKGTTVNVTVYYPNGKKRATALYQDEQQVTTTGWDEMGNEIVDFIFEKEAGFPGGLEGWRRYLEQNLNADVAAVSDAPVGKYTVKVQFIVNKEGAISNVKAISIPKKCPPCADEAVRVISQGPGWEPAVQYNRHVTYQAVQYITFQVSKG